MLGMDNFDDELLGQLLEWSPTLIATHVVAEKLISNGIKIDLIITNEMDEGLQSDIKQLSVNEQTAALSALNYLINKGYPAVNIVTDEFDVDEYLPFTSKINLVIFYDRQKIYAITSGFNKYFLPLALTKTESPTFTSLQSPIKITYLSLVCRAPCV